MLASGVAMDAHAQKAPRKPAADTHPTALPIWNNDGKVEAVLLLEPTGQAEAGARWRMGRNSLTTAFGLESGDELGLVCNRKAGVVGNIGNLASHCMLATLGDDDDDATNSQRVSASAVLSRPGGKLGLSAGTGRDTLPAWLSSGRGAGRVEQNDLTVFGQKNIGREGFVSIGGAVAKATLVPASDLPALADRWNSRSLSVGGGYGPFSANIIGRVIDVPGQPGKFEGLGLGVTWRTPWSGQLTVGAENVITRGKNPFSLTNENADEGTVPYVRYEQDL
ncbi:XOO1806 family protein [Pseudoxanthomonas mexicana]